MNREEQIRSKARELGEKYFPDEGNVWARGNIEAEYVESACIEMAEWLDQHPHWIPIEEELPKENGWYLVATPTLNSKIDVALWDGKWRRLITITHWMPIVPPRKEGKK